MNVLYESIAPHTTYTETEILDLLSKATNEYEYDCIIDSLYFVDTNPNRKTHKKRSEYSVLTRRTLKQRQARELSLQTLENYIN